MELFKTIERLKIFFYISSGIRSLTPNFIYQLKLKYWLKNDSLLNESFKDRLNYYVSPKINTRPQDDWVSLKNYKRPKTGSMYYFDLLKYLKYFPSNKKLKYKFGDVTENFDEPTIVKSRPINHNGNSVIMKINALRHFNFITDNLKFKDKKDLIVWRGEIHKENRRLLVEKFHNNPICNIGEVSKKKDYIKEWQKDFLSIRQQLQYKFILSIEGNDVATNLKWIMSSNSLCFMPKPKFETWFMEGKLKPNYHYVLIKDDYSDLLEKRNYFLLYPNKALEIIKNANNWTKKFQNYTLEKKLSIAVLNNYFKQTQQ